MQIDRVTITGADDSTSIDWMLDVTRRFPFVEWGILTSATQRGSARFPSLAWMTALCTRSRDLPIKLSLHVCGAWVRAICRGSWTPLFAHHAQLLSSFERVQLNFHAYEHLLTEKFVEAAALQCAPRNWQLIFQVDGVNDALVSNAYDAGLNAVPLYDRSGGAGKVPDQWPGQMAGIYSGYAGGLGRDNVLAEIDRIAQVAVGLIWIDMERKVRSQDDTRLDEEAVESVLKQVSSSQYLVTETLQP